MKTLKDLMAERAALEAMIDQEKKAAAAHALRQIHEWIDEFGFTAQQVFPWKQSKKVIPAKYYDPATGQSWSGRGKPPAWIAGKEREQFLIEQPLPRTQEPLLAELAYAAHLNAHRGGKR